LVNEIRHLSSEEWIHGKTPPFTLRIYSSNIDTVYDIVVVSGKIKESLHRDFPVGVYFNRAILKTNFV
jgi:hypothetical protein